MDIKRAFLVMSNKIWVVLSAAITGALVGCACYLIVDNLANPGTQYQSMTEYYIDFAFNENTKTVYDYYNSYTWNDIVETDDILGKAMEILGADYTEAEVKEAVVTELPSDIRVIHTIVTSNDPDRTAAIQQAIGQAIVEFGKDMQEFEGIRVIATEDPQTVVRVKKTGRAVEAGIIVGILLGMAGVGIWYGLDRKIRVPRDVSRYFGLDCIGVERKNSDTTKEEDPSFQKNMYYLKEKYEKLTLQPAEEAMEYTALREQDAILLGIPAERMTAEQLEKILQDLKIQDCNVIGFYLYDMKESFYRRYMGA
ncbi:MAG: hypothetical protein PHP50_09095 [Lachnospiraceae bacterium]|nr:hypothetical protein [Lachnospiraceae bacterium]